MLPFLTMRWSYHRGRLTYDVTFTTLKLSLVVVIFLSGTSAVTITKKQICSSRYSNDIMSLLSSKFHFEHTRCPAIHTLYLTQVRVNNSFFVSNWSKPLVLPRNSSVNPIDCTLSPPPTQVPFWTYIVIAGVLLVIILLACGIAVGVVLCRKHSNLFKVSVTPEGPEAVLAVQYHMRMMVI